MSGGRALLLLFVLTILITECVSHCRKCCKFNGEKYERGTVILSHGCVELKCSRKGKILELDSSGCTCESVCPFICTKDWDPVCATNGKITRTYSNPCFLKEAIICDREGINMYYLHDGECGQCSKPKGRCQKRGGKCISEEENCSGVTIFRGCEVERGCKCCIAPSCTKPRGKCKKKGGTCIWKDEPCDGRTMSRGCKGEWGCKCCLPVDVDPCSGNPCGVNADCINTLNYGRGYGYKRHGYGRALDFICQCKPQYTGDAYIGCTGCNSLCKFPFIFKGVTFNQCTTYEGYEKPWCSTKTDNQNKYIEGEWVNCDEECKAIDICLDNACGANADCFPATGGYNCICKAHYTGNAIDGCTAIELCSENSCGANAECFPATGGYKCICKAHYTGNAFDGCTAVCDSECVNGICIAPNICACNDGWEGDLCEIAVCDPICVNGGICIAPNICSCYVGWEGDRCEIAVDLDPCSGNPCGVNADCINTLNYGSGFGYGRSGYDIPMDFMCQCKPHYTGDAYIGCTDTSCWSDEDEIYYMHGDLGFWECKQYICSNGKWEETGILDPECKNDTRCWSKELQGYYKHGTNGFYDCKEYNCSHGNWVETGMIDPNPVCENETRCWNKELQKYLKHGHTGFYHCREFTCYHGDWMATGNIHPDPECKNGTRCWSEEDQIHDIHGATGFWECKQFICSNGEWEETGILDPECKKDTKCWSEIEESYYKQGTIRFFECHEYNCSYGKWIETGFINSNPECENGTCCCSEKDQLYVMQGTTEFDYCIGYICTDARWVETGILDPFCKDYCWSRHQWDYVQPETMDFFLCKEYNCNEGNWLETGITNPNCKSGSSCWFEEQQTYLVQGTTKFHLCKLYNCSDGMWIETGFTDAGCVNGTSCWSDEHQCYVVNGTTEFYYCKEYLCSGVSMLWVETGITDPNCKDGIEEIPCDWPTGQQFWPHPTNCNMYVQCTPSGPQAMTCAQGTAWSQYLLDCDHVDNTDCIGTRCWSEIYKSYFKEGTTGFFECHQYNCSNGNWVDTGIVDPDPECENDTRCWSKELQIYNKQGYTGYYNCKEMNCSHGNWVPTGNVHPDPVCENGTGCYFEMTKMFHPQGTTGFYECKEYICTDARWEETGITDPECEDISCVDELTDCAIWAGQGLCTGFGNVSEGISKMCKKSCNLCDIDMCLENRCGVNTDCIPTIGSNSIGSYICQCKPQYTGNPYAGCTDSCVNSGKRCGQDANGLCRQDCLKNEFELVELMRTVFCGESCKCCAPIPDGVEDIPCDWPTGQQFWPHPTNCRMYVQCTSSGPQAMPCAQGTAWAQNLLICDHIANTDCEEVIGPDIVFKYTSSYDLIWNDKGSGADKKGSFWRANNYTSDFCSLGDIGIEGYDHPTVKAILVSAKKSGSLVNPTNFTLIWEDHESGATWDLAVFKMNAPTGYTCLGGVAMRSWGPLPDKNEYCCVKDEYIVQGDSVFTWSDLGSGALVHFSMWTVVGGIDESGVEGGNFLPVIGYSKPVDTGYLLKWDGVKVIEMEDTESPMPSTINVTESPVPPTITFTESSVSPTANATASTMPPASVCNYTQFGSSHTKNLPANDNCPIHKRGPVTENEKEIILQTHNQLRAKVANGLETLGAPGPQPSATNMKEIQWNPQLAEVAQALAVQCKFAHDLGDNRQICNPSYYVGQNLYIAFRSSRLNTSDWIGAIDSFYNEVKDMPNITVDSFETPSSGKVIGHYTQVVWALTYEVGCGIVHYSSETWTEIKLYVCNYGPGGNYKNEKLYETGVAASNCPDGPSTAYQGLCAPPPDSSATR